MRNFNILFLFILILSISGCNAASSAPDMPIAAAAPSPPSTPTIPDLKKVGSRGWFTTAGTFAEFDPSHPSVEIWTPRGEKNAPIMVYAHGGAGLREDDRARVEMFRRHGFATISFDSYEMNGFDGWNFVTRKVTNKGKQNMIWGVFKGAVEYAAKNDSWDNQNIFLYGGSNGARVVLHSATELANNPIRGVIAEAPAANGYPLGDIEIPTIIPFGEKDNWAGRSETDYIWTRSYPPRFPMSLEQWVQSLQEKGRPVKFIFYENAGHLLFVGPLKEVTVRRGDAASFTAYEGADEEALKQHERDVFAFVNGNMMQ
jgi:dienelactone hydrolase